MREENDKLVRDNIPQIIEDEGGDYKATIYDTVDFSKALRAKLIEEAHEVSTTSTTDALISELADVFEVIDAIMLEHNISPEAVLYRKVARRKERGGFTDRIRLIWSERNDA